MIKHLQHLILAAALVGGFALGPQKASATEAVLSVNAGILSDYIFGAYLNREVPEMAA